MRLQFTLFKALVCIYFFCCCTNANAQAISSDSLLKMARVAAFNENDYSKARYILHQLLAQSPAYTDASIFLARIYAWDKNYDSSRLLLAKVLEKQPSYIDASLALADVEFWTENYKGSLQVLEIGLTYNPASRDLLTGKARVLIVLNRKDEARLILKNLLYLDKANIEAKNLLNRLISDSSKNSIGFSYDYVHFAKQFPNPWHLLSLDYSRRTKFGSFTPRVNYANRFNEGGYQFEIDAYPKISKMFYSYLNAGYSDNVGIFPHWRFGASLYANLPASFEAELGLRYLYFNDPTFIYTAYAGKYYKQFLFGLRAYVTPGNSRVSQSYNASARYYFAGADDYLGVSLGTGISPDERILNTQIASAYNLKTIRAGINGKFSFLKLNVFSYNLSINNQEYLPGEKDNQVQAGIGYTRRF